MYTGGGRLRLTEGEVTGEEDMKKAGHLESQTMVSQRTDAATVLGGVHVRVCAMYIYI